MMKVVSNPDPSLFRNSDAINPALWKGEGLGSRLYKIAVKTALKCLECIKGLSIYGDRLSLLSLASTLRGGFPYIWCAFSFKKISITSRVRTKLW